MRLLLARLKRWWYLLTYGMWRGEYAFSFRDKDGHLMLLGSGTKDQVSTAIGGKGFGDSGCTIWYQRPLP